jgi:hypothetical protein
MRAAWDLLAYFVLPLWMLAGFADYLCHRHSHIAHANGVRESLVHWLMMAEVGVPVVLAVFFRIDALLILVMIAAFIVHEITGNHDLKLAMATRKVTAFEQQVHSLLEILPLAALLLVMVLHWGQVQALLGFGPEQADFALAIKPPPSLKEMVGPFGAFVVLVLIPYGEELVRGLRRKRLDEGPGPNAS